MGSLYFWGRSIQEMGGNVVIGRSIYGVVVIDESLYSRFYGIGVKRSYSSHPFLCTLDYIDKPQYFVVHKGPELEDIARGHVIFSTLIGPCNLHCKQGLLLVTYMVVYTVNKDLVRSIILQLHVVL